MDDFVIFFLVGFFAQLIDGALGMAYGVVSASMLLAFGVPPANVSASVHAAKVFTGAASGAAHIYHKNVSFRLLWPLAAGGMVGGVIGAYVLISLDPALIKPFVAAWLGLMGAVILYRAWRGRDPEITRFRAPAPLGLLGGVLDGVGGGGWGPTVTSTLLGSGVTPRCAIGTSNTAELFVAVAVSTAFLTAFFTGHWERAEGMREHLSAVAGLIAGGVVAAPLAGWLTKALPLRSLSWAVGILVVGLSIYQFVSL